MAVLTTLGVGTLVSVVVGALGTGEEILSVPALIYPLGQDPHNASIGSFAVVGSTAIVSLIASARTGQVHWRDGMTFGLINVLGALVGSRTSVAADGVVLLAPSCVVLAVIGVIMLLRGLRPWPGADDGENSEMSGASERCDPPVVAAAATFTGFLTDFFGVGGRFIAVPMLVLTLDFSAKEVSGTPLLIIIVASPAGLAVRVGTHSSVDWPVVLTFVTALMVGGLLGGPLTKRASASTPMTAFGILFLGVCIITAYNLLIA